ncbi:hypothetical protein [Neisseria sicca]|uniref:hypothetical protein n=1 Tax=Neisseria sicca TaxID=490 RepID=UPI000B1771DF|nr:hypothetical protein [Neisseria sicca]
MRYKGSSENLALTAVIAVVAWALPTKTQNRTGRTLVSDKAQTATHLAVIPNVGFKNPTYIQQS